MTGTQSLFSTLANNLVDLGLLSPLQGDSPIGAKLRTLLID